MFSKFNSVFNFILLISYYYIILKLIFISTYCGSSAGEESACNAGDRSLIPESGRPPWRRNRLPTPVFWGFPGGSDGKESTSNEGAPGLITGWEDPLEESMATHSMILAWRIPMKREAWWSCKVLDMTE